MSEKKKPNRYALDATKFADTPAYELAVVVHRETEAQRAIEAQAFKAKHGDIPPPTNALMMGLVGPYDRSAHKTWGEYATSLDVLERCRAELGLPTGDVAKRIALELQPENWEVLFWMANWLKEIDRYANVKWQMHLQTQAIEQANAIKRQQAADAANAKNAKYRKAEEYCQDEWKTYAEKFGHDKDKFARAYVEVVEDTFKFTPKTRTIVDTWLKGL